MFESNDEPLKKEPDGTFITTAQMQFYLNRKDGKEKFKSGHEDFFEYYNLCRVYNLVSGIMQKEPDSAIMYWDEKKQIVSMGFPTDGSVAKALSRISEHGVMGEYDEYDDEEDDNLDW
tara:strand:+ start:1508 stop:1861 length:354 start_codon:yes stop_codon:yes gene_type:complete